jgi:hypothetical protein
MRKRGIGERKVQKSLDCVGWRLEWPFRPSKRGDWKTYQVRDLYNKVTNNKKKTGHQDNGYGAVALNIFKDGIESVHTDL